jgi:hypothetical protein
MTETIEPCEGVFQYSQLDAFGRSQFCSMSANRTFIGKTVSNMVNNDNTEKLFTEICRDILNNNEDNINIYVFNNVVYNLTNTDPEKVNGILFSILTEQVKLFSEWLQSSLKENTFGLDQFIRKYQRFYCVTQKLNNSLWYVNEKTARIGVNGKKYSNYNLMRSYLFYTCVINNKYEYGDEVLYLYDIFSKCLENSKTSLGDVLPLFKMFSYYKGLSYVPKENRDKLFNLDLNNMFLTSMGSNQEFVKSIVAYIFKSVKDMKGDYLDSGVYNINKLSHQFKERDIYNLYFIKYMENFLISPNTTLEQLDALNKLVKDFVKPTDNQIIQELLYKLEDTKESMEYNEVYKTLRVNTNSDKYKKMNIDANSLDKGVFSPLVIRYYAWNNAKTLDYDEFNLSNSHNFLEVYVSIYESLYSKMNPNRELHWNLNVGVGVVEIELGKKKYQFQVTTPQMLVLCKFNDNNKFTASELANELGISLRKLGPILNSFLTVKVLTRSNKPADDENMYIYLNEDFYSDNDKCTLVPLMIQQNYKLDANNVGGEVNDSVDDEVKDLFAVGRVNILQAKIVRVLKYNKTLTYNDLFTTVKDGLPFDPSDDMFDECLDIVIKQHYVDGESPINKESMYSYHEVVINEVVSYESEEEEEMEDDSDYSSEED